MPTTTTWVCLLALATAAAAAADFGDEALAADDDCQEGTGSCSLSALQLRRQRASKAMPSRRGPRISLQKVRRRLQRRETGGHIGDGRLEGAAFADYAVDVNIGSQTFQVIVDTGSSTFAVAATAGDGCWEYYAGNCGGQAVSAYYGSGNWTGYVCSGPEVTMAGLSAGSPQFAGIFQQDNFLMDCTGSFEGIVSEGIVGMAYPDLITGFNGIPLFDSVVEVSDVPNVFSMQCCGWNGREAATGQLVLGGVDESLYIGEFQYTPITRHLWFCVELVGIYVEGYTAPVHEPNSCLTDFPAVPCFLWPCGQSEGYCDDGLCACPPGECFDRTTSSCVTQAVQGSWFHREQAREGPQNCNAIVDSGTSELVLETQHYQKVMHILRAIGGPVMGGAECITSEMLNSFPAIVVQLQGDVSLSIPPTTYFQPRGDGSGCHTLFIGPGGTPSILGQPLMEAYYTVFDKENDRIGFAPIAGCE